MKSWTKFALLGGLWLSACAALATDLAVLRNGFSIRHQRHEVHGAMTRLYLGSDSSSYVDVPSKEIERFEPDLSVPASADPKNLDETIHSISARHHLDPDLVNSVIRAESGFNPRAVSPKGAQGLMQLMPETASGLGVADSFDPNANVEGGSRYLRALLERYNFDLIKALAAYNAGPGRVERYRGVPPYFETQAYVARVIRDFNKKKLAERRTAKAAASRKASARRTVSRQPKAVELSPQGSQ